MKNLKFVFLIIFFVLSALAFLSSVEQKPLTEIYKSGKIRLLPELTLNDDSLPEDIFFEAPVDLTFDSEDNIYICDYRTHNIKVFDPSGKFIKTIGREGQGPGEFQMPFYLAFAKGRLAVWELGKRRLSVLTVDGKYLTSVQMMSTDGWPRKIRSLPNGDFIVERIKTFYGDNKKPQECTIEIYSPELECKKTIYMQSIWENKYITSPRQTNVPQPFACRVYWNIAPDGKIIIGYSEKYIIEIFDSETGKLFDFSHTYDPIKITDKEKTAWFAGITSTLPQGGIKQGAPDYIVKNTKFPKYKPVFHSIIFDGEGNILVFSYPKGNIKGAGDFDAFDPTGNFIGRVQVKGDISFPSNFSRVYNQGSSFWIRGTTEEGLFQIVKYKVSQFN